MKSSVSQVSTNWKAIDGGSWFIRDTPFTEPDGHYQPGCWLSMDGWTKGDYKFDDSNCDFSVTNYICSTNDKGGNGVSPVNNVEVSVYPPGAEKGKYVINYHVTDPAGNKECSSPKRTVVVKDTLPPVIDVKLGIDTVVKGQLVSPQGQAIDKVNSDAVAIDQGAQEIASGALLGEGGVLQRMDVGWVAAAVASAVAAVALLVMQRAWGLRSPAAVNGRMPV